jgi:glycerophosphoryl diester phosphodiesterase
MSRNDKLIVVGHRGAKGYELENSIKSFAKALEQGVPWVEFDVWNVEGTPVVFHDHRLERLTDGSGYLPGLSLSYLSSVKLMNGENIPLLADVLELLVGKVSINVELKGVGTARTVVPLLRKYLAAGTLKIEHVLISSFNHCELLEAKRLLPDVRIGALIVGVPVDFAKIASDMGAYSLNPSVEFVTPELVADAHARGLKVFVFTVNHPEDVERMIDLGVDAIFSDFPDVAMGVVG